MMKDEKTVIDYGKNNNVIRPTPGGPKPSFLMQSSGGATDHRPDDNGGAFQSTNHHSTDNSWQSFNNFFPRKTLNMPRYSQMPSDSDVRHIILNAAHSILMLAVNMRQQGHCDDVDKFHYQMQIHIQHFETQVRNAGVQEELVVYARYSLCTFVDEFSVSSAWGEKSNWSQNSLLSLFHHETGGGEKFFTLLERLIQSNTQYLPVLELMYVCLSLGFEGKYRLIEKGYLELEKLRDRLFVQLRKSYGEYERELSPHWQGGSAQRQGLIQYIPIWVIFALAGVLLLASYGGFSYVLNQSIEPVAARLSAIAGQSIVDEVYYKDGH